MEKFKIWEILLFVAVILLGAIAYESHKANSRGKYVMVGSPWEVFDSETGDFWTRKFAVDSFIGDDSTVYQVYEWELFSPGPYSTHRDTLIAAQ